MKHLVILILISCFSGAVSADDDFTLVDDTAKRSATDSYGLKGRWGVGGGVGMSSVIGPDIFKDGASEMDGKLAAALWGRYHFTDRFGIELAYTRLAFEFQPAGLSDLDPIVDVLDVSATYRMWPTKVFHILFQAGVGYARITDFAATGTGKEEDDFAIKARMGVEYMATHNLMLALQGDYYKINLGSGGDSDVRVLAPMLAVTYYFGGGSSVVPDNDGDGVANLDDKCLNSIPGVPVDATGCEIPPAKLDTDKDGIFDNEDRCPGSPAGQPVNEFGCAKTEKFEITLKVQFKTGSSAIDPQFTADLQSFAEFLTKYPDTNAEIEGHTDNTGGEKFNYSISQKRAQAVVNYLVKNHKIAKKRLTAKGFGPSQPVADNTTEEGRTKNRRVVAHVITVK